MQNTREALPVSKRVQEAGIHPEALLAPDGPGTRGRVRYTGQHQDRAKDSDVYDD